jgi:hypothetical protein
MCHLQAHKLEVALVDTNDKDDVYINDVLVNEGLAEYETNRWPSPRPPPPQRVSLLEQLQKLNII